MKNNQQSSINSERIGIIAVIFLLVIGLMVSVGFVFGLQSAEKSERGEISQFLFLPVLLNAGVQEVAAPELVEVEADDATILEGETAVISWKANGVVSRVEIEPEPVSISGNTAVVRPTETTNYQITLFNSSGSSTINILIEVFSADAPAVISDFSAADEAVAPGGSTTLSWDVDGLLDSLDIAPGVGDVLGETSVIVAPTETTTYTLTAVNAFGTTTADTVVQVIAPPTVDSFTAAPEVVLFGEQTTFSWTTTGEIDSLTLNPGGIDVTGESSISITPTETTTYTLTAENLTGYDSATQQIVVNRPPEIAAFDATVNNPLYIGDDVQFNWEILHAPDTVEITPNVGDVTALSETTISATTDLTYTLTATNAFGSATADYFVDVVEAPTIIEFSTNDDAILVGDSVTLTWNISGDYTSASLSHSIGDVALSGQVVVSPTANTTYQLTAVNGSGTTTASVLVRVSSGDTEITFFTWNGEMTQARRGFANDNNPDENYDWTTPINFAEGTIYVRAEVIEQEVPQQDMRMQLCIWQEEGGDNFGLETCLRTKNVPGNPGTVVCWSQAINSMWKLDGNPLDWTRPRFRVGVPIKNGDGDPVSNHNGWQWNGEDPAEWYPLNFRFTAVVVAQGATFSGFDDCTP